MLRVLEYQSHLAPQLFFLKIVIVNIFSVKINMTGGCLDQTVQMLHQRGFTGAGMSNQTDKLSVGNFQTDIIQCFYGKGGIVSVYMTYMIQYQ